MYTGSDLSTLFQDRAEQGITVNALVPAETSGTFLEDNSAMMHAIRYTTRCISMEMEVKIGAEHRKVTILVPEIDVAHEAKISS